MVTQQLFDFHFEKLKSCEQIRKKIFLRREIRGVDERCTAFTIDQHLNNFATFFSFYKRDFRRATPFGRR